MPIILFHCAACKRDTRKLIKNPKDTPPVPCHICKGETARKLSAPSSTSKITVDNGVQGRAIEIDMKVIESNKENSTKDFREK